MRALFLLPFILLSWLCSNLLAQTTFEQAIALTKQSRYAEAQRLLDGAQEPGQTARRIAFHRLKAAIASGLGAPDSAAREMGIALALAPHDSNLLLATAIAEMQAGLLDEALRHARSAGNSAMAAAVQGDVQDKQGDFAGAAQSYQKAVELAPHQEPYRIALATELIQHQSFPSAIELLKKSQVLFANSVKLWTLLGIAQYASGFSDEAILAFEKALAADPRFNPAYSCLARVVLESSARPQDQAVDLLCGWNAIACSAVHLRVAREQGDQQAISRAITALRQAPTENVTAHCELARAYEWSDRLGDAREQMEICVSLDPTPQNHYRLGRLYQRLDLPGLAQKEMQLRSQLQAKMSDQTAAGLSALQTFKLSLN